MRVDLEAIVWHMSQLKQACWQLWQPSETLHDLTDSRRLQTILQLPTPNTKKAILEHLNNARSRELHWSPGPRKSIKVNLNFKDLLLQELRRAIQGNLMPSSWLLNDTRASYLVKKKNLVKGVGLHISKHHNCQVVF